MEAVRNEGRNMFAALRALNIWPPNYSKPMNYSRRIRQSSTQAQITDKHANIPLWMPFCPRWSRQVDSMPHRPTASNFCNGGSKSCSKRKNWSTCGPYLVPNCSSMLQKPDNISVGCWPPQCCFRRVYLSFCPGYRHTECTSEAEPTKRTTDKPQTNCAT